MDILSLNKVIVKQHFEGFELLGYETRNKYAIMDENKNKIGFAAEQQKGIFGFLLRQFLGHWRSFDVHFFDVNKKEFLVARHPFRFFFQRFEIYEDGRFLGALQQRFSIFRKKFDVLDERETVLMEMNSSFLQFWTFPFRKRGQEIARIEKKWTGLLAEFFTDKDTFLVSFDSPGLMREEKMIILASSIFVDLQYFERKAR